MSSVTPAAAPGSWPAPAPSTLWSVVVWRWRGQRRCGLTPPRPPRATHLYVRRNTKLRSNDLRPVRVVGRYNVPVHPGRSVVVPPAVRAVRAARRLAVGCPGPPWPRRCCAAPRIPHGPESPTPQRPMQRPSARLHPNHRGPSRPVTPVRVRPRHMTNADTFHIVHASPAVHSLTRHHTYSW